MAKNLIQEDGMQKFYSPDFGFLHACAKDSKVWYNLSDVCRYLNLRMKEVEQWLVDTKAEVRWYNVKRTKVIVCNRYVDNDGMSTILIFCCRSTANSYRKWINQTVLYSFKNPEMSKAIKEIDDATCSQLTSAQIEDHYKAMANQDKRKKIVKKAKSKVNRSKNARKIVEVLSSPTPNSPFVPKGGHLLIEDWFRREFPVMEFVGILDGLISDARKGMALIDKKDKWEAQHRINVMKVFKDMVAANEGNLKYAPDPDGPLGCKVKAS